MASSRICSIEGCDKPVVGRGWCHKHYKRWQLHKDPLVCRGRHAPQIPEGFYRCPRCEELKPDTEEYFYRRGNGSIIHTCRQCTHIETLAKRQTEYARRKKRMAEETKEERDTRLAIRRAKAKAHPTFRASRLKASYHYYDFCDLTTAEVQTEIDKPCSYCGTTEHLRGLDRVDNRLPHIKGNVIPACGVCNIVRGNRFNVAEMKLIGAVIHDIRAARQPEFIEPKIGLPIISVRESLQQRRSLVRAVKEAHWKEPRPLPLQRTRKLPAPVFPDILKPSDDHQS